MQMQADKVTDMYSPPVQNEMESIFYHLLVLAALSFYMQVYGACVLQMVAELNAAHTERLK